jgi:hypothetical protein
VVLELGGKFPRRVLHEAEGSRRWLLIRPVSQKELFEAAGMEAHQEVRRLVRPVCETMPNPRGNPHEITWAKGEDLLIQQEFKAALLNQEGFLNFPVPVDAIANRPAGSAGSLRRHNVLHQRISTVSLRSEHQDAATVGAILEGRPAGNWNVEVCRHRRIIPAFFAASRAAPNPMGLQAPAGARC